MPHVLVVGQLHPSGREILSGRADVATTFIDTISEDEYAAHIETADALLLRTQSLTAPTVNRGKHLRIVSRHGVGYDAVDVQALNARGIALAVCGDVNSTTVAEHAMMLILAAAKRALRGDAAIRTGSWGWRNNLESQDLNGQNLLLFGYGRIGRKTGAMASGFGMQVRAYDPFLLAAGWPEGSVSPIEDLHSALGWADIISISVPGAGEPLIAGPEFAAMRDGTILVNTARGGVVQETALLEALRTGRIGAAGLDVFEQEPLPADHALCQFDQVILSPHIAGVTSGSAERMAIDSARNIIDFFDGAIDPNLVVNRDQVHDRLQT